LKKPLILIFSVLLMASACLASAKTYVHWAAKLIPADARAGESAQVVLTATIDAPWHIYDLEKKDQGPVATSFALKGASLTINGSTVAPPAKRLQDPNFGMEVGEYESAVSFAVPVKIAATSKGAGKGVVTASFQSCNARICMPPANVDVPFEFSISPGTARPDHLASLTSVPAQPPGYATPTAGPPAASKDEFSQSLTKARQSGLLAFVWFAFSTGLLALLTPCVFPMIPITVSYFAKATGDEKKVNYGGALAYCLGIMGTFTALGLAVALIFGASKIQEFAANPYLNIALAVLFIGLALSLFGVFEIGLPSKMLNRAHSASRKGGILGPILMGLTFTLTSFTCTVPFVGTILVAAANGDIVYPLIGMIAFSAAFALPFFLLAMFPQYLAKLPKSGAWLNTVKGFMAFLELAAAVKFISNADLIWQLGAITRPVFLALWAIISTLAALYLFGLFVVAHAPTKPKVGPLRIVFAVLMVVTAIYCLGGLRGGSLGELNAFLPPERYPGLDAAVAAGDLHWVGKYSEASALASSQKKAMFVNFTGVTCTNCRWMEQNMFTRPEVQKLIGQYVPVELYTDRPTADDQANKKLERDLTKIVAGEGSEALPMYIIVTPEGKPLKAFEGSTRDISAFVAFLQTGTSSRVAAN
jgi:thiol:disulfide interchange protein